MRPFRSGILDMITVSLGLAAFCVAVLCASTSGAEKATDERTSSANPTRDREREDDLVGVSITTAP